MSKPRGEGPSPPSSIAPSQSFPEGPSMTVPVLGHPSLEESYHHWLTRYPPRAKQGEVKGGRGGVPAREISFVSLVAYGPKVRYLGPY